jgi:beta-glucanase (GH16 family)
VGRVLVAVADEWTEMDVVEQRAVDSGDNNISNTWEGALHWNGYGSSEQSLGSSVPNLGLESGMHLYGILWTPTGYTFYVDNKVVWTATQGISGTPQYLILSCEVENGGWAGDIPTAGYGALGTSSTSMEVDYVHAYSMPEPSLVVLVFPLALMMRRVRR